MEQTMISFSDQAFDELRAILEERSFSKLLILVDSHTHEHCYPYFMQSLAVELKDHEVVEVPPGEESKSLEVLANLWMTFGDLGLDRQSLIINLGGGMVCDLGGFAAATFMRGLPHINFPTSLLAMADAAVGGKTGINFDAYKNRIGVFKDPLLVGVVPEFLETLASEQRLSGWAEMLKHGLLGGIETWTKLTTLDIDQQLPSVEMIEETIALKKQVVLEDREETSLRKILNLGHTVGHALESYFTSTPVPISHGHAVALGLQIELYISFQTCGLAEEEFLLAYNYLAKHYYWPDIPIEKDSFLRYLRGDKKNERGLIRMVLLEALGKPRIDEKVSEELVWDSLQRIVHG